jgi:hypothetical protein
MASKLLGLGCAVGLAFAVPVTLAPVFFAAVEVFAVAAAVTLEAVPAATVMLDAARVLFDAVRVQFDAAIVPFNAAVVLFDAATVTLHAVPCAAPPLPAPFPFAPFAVAVAVATAGEAVADPALPFPAFFVAADAEAVTVTCGAVAALVAEAVVLAARTSMAGAGTISDYHIASLCNIPPVSGSAFRASRA